MTVLRKTGVPTLDDLKKVMPSEERLHRGPVAVFECFERIPCNPCYDSCKRGAVRPFGDVNDLPEVDFDKCNGCASCVAACPGLAVFVVDMTYSETEGLVKLPYEFLPLPEVGQPVDALDREGKVVGKGRVVKIQKARARTATPVVWVAVPKGLTFDVRNIAFGGEPCEESCR